MKVELSWIVGICLGNLVSCIIIPESDTIKFFNTVCNLLIAVYIVQNQSKEQK